MKNEHLFDDTNRGPVYGPETDLKPGTVTVRDRNGEARYDKIEQVAFQGGSVQILCTNGDRYIYAEGWISVEIAEGVPVV